MKLRPKIIFRIVMWIIFVPIGLGLLLYCVAIFAGMRTTNKSPDHAFIATLSFARDQTDILSVVKSFSEKYHLGVAYGFKSPDGQDFLLEMSSWRVLIDIVTIKPNVYDITSLNLTPNNPAVPSTSDLMNELEAEIEKISGATVVVTPIPIPQKQ